MSSDAYRKDIILASASPRRREMFMDRGIPVRICPSHVEEDLPMEMDPAATVMYLALKKAEDVAGMEKGLIIAADTIVLFEGEIIGKPADEEEAFDTLSRMRDNTHKVLTGVCIIDNAGEELKKSCLWEESLVYFGHYSDEELLEYVRTDEPYDKAGGYAVQMTFGKYIYRIDGDRDNVIGLPMYRLEEYLR